MPQLTHPAPLNAIAEALRSGELDLFAYLDEVCDRIEAVEPHVHGLLPEPDRRGRLKYDAAGLLTRYPPDVERPPLFGVPVGVKDIFRVDGFPTQCGSALPAELFEGNEARVVTQLRKAGALVLGKTVTTEFAYFEPGPTRNPQNPDHTPGGSSSGSAAAVAAGYCPLALGSQTVGSVIRPAAFCGVTGFKPTYDRVSRSGIVPYAPSLDHVGLFVEHPGDLFRVAEALFPDYCEPLGRAFKLGVPEGAYLPQASPEALEAFEQQLAAITAVDSCWSVHRIPIMDDIKEINQRHQIIAARELAETHRDWFARYEELYRPRTAAQIRTGQKIRDQEYRAALAGCIQFHEYLAGEMKAHGLDAWVCPAAVGPAPEGIHATGDPCMNLPWTQAGLPVITIPVGRAKNGLPLGLQCIGKPWEDIGLITAATGLAYCLEEAGLR